MENTADKNCKCVCLTATHVFPLCRPDAAEGQHPSQADDLVLVSLFVCLSNHCPRPCTVQARRCRTSTSQPSRQTNVCQFACLCVCLSNHHPCPCTVQARRCRRLTSRPSRQPQCVGAVRTWTSCTSLVHASSVMRSSRGSHWRAQYSRSLDWESRAHLPMCMKAEPVSFMTMTPSIIKEVPAKEEIGNNGFVCCFNMFHFSSNVYKRSEF